MKHYIIFRYNNAGDFTVLNKDSIFVIGEENALIFYVSLKEIQKIIRVYSSARYITIPEESIAE